MTSKWTHKSDILTRSIDLQLEVNFKIWAEYINIPYVEDIRPGDLVLNIHPLTLRPNYNENADLLRCLSNCLVSPGKDSMKRFQVAYITSNTAVYNAKKIQNILIPRMVMKMWTNPSRRFRNNNEITLYDPTSMHHTTLTWDVWQGYLLPVSQPR